MTHDCIKLNKDYLSEEIITVNYEGERFITAFSLSVALNVSQGDVLKALGAASRTLGDASVLTINMPKSSHVICNARGFVAIAHQFMRGPFAKDRQAAVLEALLKGVSDEDMTAEGTVSRAEVLSLRLSLTEKWLADAERELVELKGAVA